MCTGNDPACPVHGVAASNARENAFYQRGGPVQAICVRCGDVIDEEDLAADEYGRPLHSYCSDDDRSMQTDPDGFRGSDSE